MSDTRTIIESGVLELYVAGALTPPEQAEVERAIATSAEVAAEVQRIAAVVERYASRHRRTPRAHVRGAVMAAIADAERPPGKSAEATATAEPISVHVLPRAPRQPWMVAASIALALGLTPSAYYYVQYKAATEELDTLHHALAEARMEGSVLAQRTSFLNEALGRTADSNVVRIAMAGTASAPGSRAVVWWNRASKDVMLDMHAMPALAENEDYQLWAIVDGKPVDLGVFNPASADDGAILMKTVGTPQAFAVTVEPKGGRPTPTLERLVVIGNV